jgi:tetratricopeptide (TPR) repeat protein
MKVADLLLALSELRAGRVTVDQLIAACSAWSKEPTRPLADFLKPTPAVPLAEPASGILSPPRENQPPSRRTPPTRQSRTLVLVAAGVGVVALIGMAVGLGYLGQANARLEAANAKLAAANADLEATNGELAAARPPADQPREHRASVKPDPVRESTTTTTTTAPPKTAEPSKSLRALEENLAKLQKSPGPDDARTVRAAADLGRALVDAGRPAEAVPLLEDVDRRARNEPWARAAAVALAHALWATGHTDRAVEVCERVRDELPENDPLMSEARVQAALAYRAAGKWDKAKPLFLDHLVFARQANKERQTADALAWMGECLLRVGDLDGAERLVRECVDLWTRHAANDWAAFAAKSLLGEVLLAQKKPEQAEALLTAGYDGLKAHKDAIPWDRRDALPAAVGRLVRLYETTGDKDKAAEWKKVEEQDREKK